MKYRGIAIALLLGCLFNTFAWQLAEPKLMGHVWSLSGSLLRLLLIGLVAVAFRSKWIALVALFMAGEELIVLGCTTAFLVNPWIPIPGESCTARLNLPLGVLGAVLGLAILISLVRPK